MMPTSKNITKSGFSLIEISLVIVIIAVLVGMAVFSTQSRMDAARTYMTKQRMQTIIDAIDRYVEQYGKLPCPYDIGVARTAGGYGVGDENDCINSGLIRISTDVYLGGVPFKTLGLDSQTAVDGWDMRFQYAVVGAYTSKVSFTDYADTSNSRNFTVFNKAGENTTSRVDAAYLLLTTGPNGYGGYRDKNGNRASSTGASDFELENADASDEEFFQFIPNNEMDDIVLLKTRWQLPKFINN